MESEPHKTYWSQWQFSAPVYAYETWRTNGLVRVTGSGDAMLCFSRELEEWAEQLIVPTEDDVKGIRCRREFRADVTLELKPQNSLVLWLYCPDQQSRHAFADDLRRWASFLRRWCNDVLAEQSP